MRDGALFRVLRTLNRAGRRTIRDITRIKYGFRGAARSLRLPLARSSRRRLFGGHARGTDAMDFALAFHLSAVAVQSAAASSTALVTVGVYWCVVVLQAEFACCIWHRVRLSCSRGL